MRPNLLGLICVASILEGCPGPPGVCTAYKSSANLTSPAVTFQADVAPIFAQSCTFSACHSASAAGSLDLLDIDGGVTPRAIVGVDATEFPTMKLVAAGDPSNSYLMHKMDGDGCSLPGCDDGGFCNVLMPQTSSVPLDVATRDTVRRWIAQGAQDN